jgi:hypothetical protein
MAGQLTQIFVPFAVWKETGVQNVTLAGILSKTLATMHSVSTFILPGFFREGARERHVTFHRHVLGS